MHKNYSNNMKDAVETFCGECDKTMLLSELEDHIESQHELSLSEYNRFYRKASTQLISITYHKCKLCWKDLVLDKIRIVQHLKKCHAGKSFVDYKHQFLTETSTTGKGQELVSIPSLLSTSNPAASLPPSKLISSKKHLPIRPQEILSRRAPWPECSSCGRNFKSNMHLKMHIRREHLWSIWNCAMWSTCRFVKMRRVAALRLQSNFPDQLHTFPKSIFYNNSQTSNFPHNSLFLLQDPDKQELIFILILGF